tara:strand:- start:38 stop:790 length:753 start_codon:yes stop_codon:yes gene_type:complete
LTTALFNDRAIDIAVERTDIKAMPIFLIIAVVFLVVIFGPSFWVKRQVQKHARPRPDFPGTGGELALHLISQAGLTGVGVEPIEDGADHYDPQSRTVHLSRSFYRGKSVSAVAVAAHEVGHALQHARNEKLFHLRMALARSIQPISKIAGVLLLVGPMLSLLLRAPGMSLIFLLLGILALVFQLLVHLVTLPVEFDASFGKALPILAGGGYLQSSDLPATRSVLRAASLTYVAQSLAGVFNLWTLLRLLR